MSIAILFILAACGRAAAPMTSASTAPFVSPAPSPSDSFANQDPNNCDWDTNAALDKVASEFGVHGSRTLTLWVESCKLVIQSVDLSQAEINEITQELNGRVRFIAKPGYVPG